MTTDQTVPRSLLPLMIGAIGVVYGDIGTSPLYTMKEIFTGPHGVQPTVENILGILSLIFWALIFVISVKYVLFVMNASNRGEGGVMALMALALHSRHRPAHRNLILSLGLFGTAMFYGDGVITPAISVLSAIEGLQVATPALQPYVLPSACGVLVALFLFQRHGTDRVGKLFGPIMSVWFIVLAALGWHSIQQSPEVFEALRPRYAFNFLVTHGQHAFITLGAVVLALTGAEALYADMGHFGKRPIQAAWFAMVFPALALNYFGQGALIMRSTSAVENPFYLMVPDWGLYPMVGLATVATVIASQAVISGAFSITSQAIHMDYLPRMQSVHTSSDAMGQIYLPAMNRLLLFIVLLTVLTFKSSSNLAAAYGIAVTGTMSITTMLWFVVVVDSWKWPLRWALVVAGLFLTIDLAFLGANVLKIPQGGWFPLVMGAVLFMLMTTWRKGRQVLFHHLQKAAESLTGFIAQIPANPPYARVPGTAVYLTARHLSMPHALQQNLKHNQIIHQRVVLLTIVTEDIPQVPVTERVEVDCMEEGFYRVTARYGFMETPDVPEALGMCRNHGLSVDLREASFFIGRETIIPSSSPDLGTWQERLFSVMFRNTSSPIQFFNIPSERVIELGVQIEV